MAVQVVRTASLVAFAALLALAYPGGAGAVQDLPGLPEAQPPLRTGGRAVRPIAAWKDFCAREPGSCAVSGSEPERIVLDAETWTLIQDVNAEVNEAVVPSKDIDHRGVVDLWEYPSDGIGDCEDYQLLKRRLLASVGVPWRAMRMTVVIDESGEGHAVLTILSDRGDLVLDNKLGFDGRPKPVMQAADTGYEYIKREGSEPGPDGGPWVSLGPDPSTVAVAAAGPVRSPEEGGR